MPISGAPARRATISATSRSRPKNTSASSTSNDASPLNGQATTSARARVRRARGGLQLHDVAGEVVLGRAQPVRSLAARRPRRPGVAPPRARAHSRAARCSSAARRRSPRASRSTGISTPSRASRVSCAAARTAVGVERRRARASRRRRWRREARSRPSRARAPGASSVATRSSAARARRQRGRCRRPRAASAAGGRALSSAAAAPPAGSRPRIEHLAAVAVHLRRELGRQPRLAHPGRAGDQHRAGRRRARARRQCSRSQASSASRPASGVPATSSGGSSRLWCRPRQRRVLRQYGPLQPAQPLARLDAELARPVPAGLPVGL